MSQVLDFLIDSWKDLFDKAGIELGVNFSLNILHVSYLMTLSGLFMIFYVYRFQRSISERKKGNLQVKLYGLTGFLLTITGLLSGIYFSTLG